eukprot:1158322-Pelagomonas_calceolata.AAC.3
MRCLLLRGPAPKHAPTRSTHTRPQQAGRTMRPPAHTGGMLGEVAVQGHYSPQSGCKAHLVIPGKGSFLGTLEMASESSSSLSSFSRSSSTQSWLAMWTLSVMRGQHAKKTSDKRYRYRHRGGKTRICAELFESSGLSLYMLEMLLCACIFCSP